jgi:hypothetical protein
MEWFENGYGREACRRRCQGIGLRSMSSTAISNSSHQGHDQEYRGTGCAQERNPKENFQQKGHEWGSGIDQINGEARLYRAGD